MYLKQLYINRPSINVSIYWSVVIITLFLFHELFAKIKYWEQPVQTLSTNNAIIQVNEPDIWAQDRYGLLGGMVESGQETWEAGEVTERSDGTTESKYFLGLSPDQHLLNLER